MRVVLATTNEHKVHELRAILADLVEELGLEIVSTADIGDLPDVAETEVTFVGNATLKARAIAESTGLPTLADDSGLTVDVLGGAPGVFSARWSGSHAGADALARRRTGPPRASARAARRRPGRAPWRPSPAPPSSFSGRDHRIPHRRGAARSPGNLAAATDSATTRSSFPRISRTVLSGTLPSTPTLRRTPSVTAVGPSAPSRRSSETC